MRRKIFCAVMTIIMIAALILPAAIPVKAAENLATLVSSTSDGGTLRLTSDVTVTNHLYINKNIVIEGNGHNYNVTGNKTALIINSSNISGLTVTVRNLNIITDATSQGFVQVRNGGTVIFENCTFKATKGTLTTAYFSFNNGGGTLNMNDCSVNIQNSNRVILFDDYDVGGNRTNVTLNNVTADLQQSAPNMTLARFSKDHITVTGKSVISVGATAFTGINYNAYISDTSTVTANKLLANSSIILNGESAPIIESGASIRIKNSSRSSNVLRFTVFMPHEYADIAKEFGILIAKWDDVKAVGSFTVEALNAAGKTYKLALADTTKLGQNGLTYDWNRDGYCYNAAIINIPESAHDTKFAAVAYAMYGEGENARVLYSQFNEHDNVRSLMQVANAAYTDVKFNYDSSRYCYSVRDGLYSPYNSDEIGVIEEYADSSHVEKYSAVATVTGSSANFNTWVYQEEEGGLMIREVKIDGYGMAEPVEIVQITDIHINKVLTAAEGEYEKALWTASSSGGNRTWLANGVSMQYALNSLAYADEADQIVLTGDIYDYISKGAIGLVYENIWSRYYGTDKLMAVLGNHDAVQIMGKATSEEFTLEERMNILMADNNWGEYNAKTVSGGDASIFYSSKLLGKAMLIQIDNGSQGDASEIGFREEQVELLRADLEYARANGCAVLLFYHVPLATGDITQATVKSHLRQDTTDRFYGKADMVGTVSALKTFTDCSSEIYSLITDNADIIEGAFCGHIHEDYYTEIIGTGENGGGHVVPQHILTCNAYVKGITALDGNTYNAKGHVLKITVS